MSAASRSASVGLAAAILLIAAYAYVARPAPGSGFSPGSDAQEYVHLAVALQHGTHLVEYDGPARPTRFTPGFSLLLIPALALGGFDAAVWVPFLAALVLGALAALLAFRIEGGLAAPIAVVLALYTASVYVMAHLVMSDVPATAVALIELWLITAEFGRPAAALAGLMGGLLVWIRPGSLVLVAAGIAGCSAFPNWRSRLACYVAGLLLPLVCLAWWQWAAFGSPWLSSYQATHVSPDGSSALTGFFAWQYVFGPPWNTYSAGTQPNALVYAQTMVGLGDEGMYPGVGLLGLLGAIVLARGAGMAASVGRFTLASTAATLLLYVPYFYRDPRFLMLPVTLCAITAAVTIARCIRAVRGVLRRKTSRVTREAQPDLNPGG